MLDPGVLKWVIFNLGVLALLALDLGVFNRRPHVITVKEALLWSGIWIALSLFFNLGVFLFRGEQAALEFLAGYLIEKSLSVDNIFVFVLIFSYFQVGEKYQHRVLFWGILGALLMRGILIAIGAALIHNVSWIVYVFGGFLILTGLRMAVQPGHAIQPERNPIVRLVRRLVPVTPEFHGKEFFVKLNGRTFATPLLLVLVVVEVSDLIFAVDSIPAIFAITEDPFIVYTSNVCAILGLRSLYFALAGVIHRFHYLKVGLAMVLIFVGLKMLLAHTPYKIATGWSLLVVALILGISVIMSLLMPPKPEQKNGDTKPHH